MTQLLRDVDQQNPREAALMGNLEEMHAKRKVVSLLYISIGKTGRKMLMDKFPHINILTIQLQDMAQHCTESFQIRRNRTLDRHTFLSRKQKPNETLHQFWNILNGLAARCDFGNQTEWLVYDIFVLNMANKQVQEKLCVKLKDNPADAIQFAIAFEDGLSRQRTYCYINQEPKVKDQQVFSVRGATQNNRKCWRCGAANCTLDHLNCCKAPDSRCNYCGKNGHLKRYAIKSDKNQNFGKNREFAKRVQLVDQDLTDDEDENYMVLNVERKRQQYQTLLHGRLQKWK